MVRLYNSSRAMRQRFWCIKHGCLSIWLLTPICFTFRPAKAKTWLTLDVSS